MALLMLGGMTLLDDSINPPDRQTHNQGFLPLLFCDKLAV